MHFPKKEQYMKTFKITFLMLGCGCGLPTFYFSAIMIAEN